MPTDFKLMDKNTVLTKYPNEGRRPSEVYTNDKNSINLVFTHSSKKSSVNDIKKHAEGLVNVLKQKGVDIIEQKQETINEKSFFCSNVLL